MDKMPLKAFRVSLDLTQDDMAKLLGINRGTYAKWERYESYPDVMQLIKMADIFKCSLDSFYFPINASQKLANQDKPKKTG